MKDASSDAFMRPAEPRQPLFTIHENVEQIIYEPEDALKEGLGMVKTLKSSLREKVKLSKLREEVWLREIERFVIGKLPPLSQ